MDGSPTSSGQDRPPAGPRRVLSSILRPPLTRRALGELLFCVVGVLVGLGGFALIGLCVAPGTAVSLSRGVAILAVLVVLLVASGAALELGGVWRGLAGTLLGARVPPPPPLRLDPGWSGRFARRLRDGAGWRAFLYLLLRLPLALLDLYVLLYWAGVANMTYPFWWRLFRNHPANVRLGSVPFLTPFGAFRVSSFAGTFLVLAEGVAMVLAAPWVTRAVTSLDRWLVRGLLGPGGLAARVRTLEEARARAVDESASTLRRIERDLHDGTQAQLATLAMNLGRAKEKLEVMSDVPVDLPGAVELIETAHRQAKEALVELRDIARGIHPPALDVGLDAALATLVARSAVPAELDTDVPTRPTRAIETIAYFSVAELLANVAKHSRARRALVEVRARDGRVRLRVTDDGVGGARSGSGSGLTGLADRVRAVDGRLRVDSPAGGPTVVTVELPLHA